MSNASTLCSLAQPASSLLAFPLTLRFLDESRKKVILLALPSKVLLHFGFIDFLALVQLIRSSLFASSTRREGNEGK